MDKVLRTLFGIVCTLVPLGPTCYWVMMPDVAHSEDTRQTITPGERRALVALYKSTDGDHWERHDGWLGAPGTECSWYGVTCDTTPQDSTTVVSLEVSENNLHGALPEELGLLPNLEWLMVFGNHLSGLLPKPIIQRWLTGELWIGAEASLLSDVSEIDFEVSASAVLCAEHRIILRSDGSVRSFTERCRNVTPDDRTTFCEVREGRVSQRGFAKLGRLIEERGFFTLRAEYTRSITEGAFVSTRVTREGKSYAVVNYADAGPLELWDVERAIEGVAAMAEWQKTTEQASCPRWKQ